MLKRTIFLAIIVLLICSFFGWWNEIRAVAQDPTSDNFTNEIALLAVSPPPLNSGVLNFYNFHDGGEANLESATIHGYPLSANWSPDGSTLAFIMITNRNGSEAPPSDFDIYRVDHQGKNLIKLTDTPDCPKIGLIWPSGSNYLYFSGFCRDSQSTMMWRIDPNSGSSEKLGEVHWDATWAVWSPDASHLALLAPRKAADGSSFTEVNLATSDGLSMTNLMDDAHAGYQLQQSTILTWSPRGDWLVYATKAQKTEQGLVNQIVLVRPDGTERSILYTSQPGYECLNPAWSPDGQRVAFTCNNNLFSIQTNGSDLINLTDPSAGQAIEYPIWATDGKNLVFVSLDSDGKRRLENVHADGTGREIVKEIDAIQLFGLNWNPVPQSNLSGGNPTSVSTDLGQVISTKGPSPEVKQGIASTSDENSGNNLSTIWLLGLLLVAGGAGVFVLLRRTGKLPNIVKQEEVRRVRREHRQQVRQTHSSASNSLQNEFEDKKKIIMKQAEGRINVGQEFDTISQHTELLQQGIDQIRNKDIQKGIDTLRQYLELAPDDPNAWLWLGWASGLIKEYRTAERCFLRAERLGSPQANEALEWLSNQHK